MLVWSQVLSSTGVSKLKTPSFLGVFLLLDSLFYHLVSHLLKPFIKDFCLAIMVFHVCPFIATASCRITFHRIIRNSTTIAHQVALCLSAHDTMLSMAGVEGVEPSWTALETVLIPYSPLCVPHIREDFTSSLPLRRVI